MLLLYLEEGRRLVNTSCEELEPWQIIGATLISTLGAVWVKGFLFQQECMFSDYGIKHVCIVCMENVMNGCSTLWKVFFGLIKHAAS